MVEPALMPGSADGSRDMSDGGLCGPAGVDLKLDGVEASHELAGVVDVHAESGGFFPGGEPFPLASRVDVNSVPWPTASRRS